MTDKSTDDEPTPRSTNHVRTSLGGGGVGAK
jgi:hypothetical protein